MYIDTKQLTLDFIKPLCDKTRELFQPCNINTGDRISLGMSKDAKHFRAEIFTHRPDYTGTLVKAPASYNAAVRFPQRVPERRHFSDTKWQFGASDTSALLIAFHWNRDQISFVDEATRTIYCYQLARYVAQTRNIVKREMVNGFRFVDHPDFPLAGYQVSALKGSLGAEGYGLFMEQGTGKTAVCIARICNEALLKPPGEQYRVLVVCPKNVRSNWVAELEKFATVPGRATVVRGDKLDRFKCLVESMMRPREGQELRYTATIMSYDSVDRTFEPLELVDWDLCILDESHYIKNMITKRWKAMEKLRDKCKARMVLTGTPITNTMLDLYTQFEFMGQGWSGFSSWEAFKKFYAIYTKIPIGEGQNQGVQQRKLTGLGNVPMLQERLARQAYLIKKSVALPNLPKKLYDVSEVEMTKDQADTYRQLCDNLMIELEDDMANANAQSAVLVVNNILTKMLRLAQVTSGFVATTEAFDDNGNSVTPATVNRFDPNPKVEELVSILKQKNPSQKTIVWACFIQDIKTIAARLRLEGIEARTYYGATSDWDRVRAVEDFNNDPNCRVLIGNAAAGGTGINLLGYDNKLKWHWPAGPNTWCDHVIYFSQGWSHPHRSQSEDRAHRRGTASVVQYTDLVVPNTIDEEIRMRVLDKRKHAMKVQDIREILLRMRG